MNGRHQSTPPPNPATRPEDPWTVGRLLTWTTDYLKRHGSESPRLDAEVMLAHVLDWQRVQLYTHFEEEVSQASRTAFRELVRRRCRRVRRWPISSDARSFIRSPSRSRRPC